MTTAYYKSYPGATKQQYGGVSLWSTGQAAHRIKDSGIDLATGEDRFGLGRWAWTRYAGRNGVSLRVIAAYRPVLNKRGPMSVWNQQKVYWQSHNVDELFVSPGLDSLRCGYFPMQFDHRSLWVDHRSLWVDIPYCLAFGCDVPPIVRP
jgi:hypothetical protein